MEFFVLLFRPVLRRAFTRLWSCATATRRDLAAKECSSENLFFVFSWDFVLTNTHLKQRVWIERFEKKDSCVWLLKNRLFATWTSFWDLAWLEWRRHRRLTLTRRCSKLIAPKTRLKTLHVFFCFWCLVITGKHGCKCDFGSVHGCVQSRSCCSQDSLVRFVFDASAFDFVSDMTRKKGIVTLRIWLATVSLLWCPFLHSISSTEARTLEMRWPCRNSWFWWEVSFAG